MSNHLARAELNKARDQRAGCVYLAYDRESGALRGVYRAREALDWEGWATVCETHSTLVLSETRRLAQQSGTLDFCDECRARKHGDKT